MNPLSLTHGTLKYQVPQGAPNLLTTNNKDPMVEKESKTLGHILFNADTESDAIAIAEHRLLRFKEEVEGEMKEKILAAIEKKKNRHELDREVYIETAGGNQCARCGEQGYEEGEECGPDEWNAALNVIRAKLLSK